MAAVNTQFAVAVHIMAVLANKDCGSCTSATMAASVNATPSFVRRILAMLVKADLVKTVRGAAGFCCLARPAEAITLLHIHAAVEPPKVFALHQYPPKEKCPTSCRMRQVMTGVLDDAQARMEESLSARTLSDLVASIRE